jgi:colicin import membrane protein
MKVFLLAVGVALCCSVWADDDASVQRQAIAKQRQEAQARFDAEAQACAKKFVVTACTNEAAARRRGVENELNRRETVLNDSARAQRGTEQIQRIEDKAREREASEAERQSQVPAASAGEKESAQREKQAQHAAIVPMAKTAASGPKSGNVNAASHAANRDAFAHKQREALEHRNARDKRLRDVKQPARQLPLPP